MPESQTDSAKAEAPQERRSFQTYAALLNTLAVVPSQKTNYTAVERDHFVAFLEPHLARIALDEAWYLEQNPDVREAIARGVLRDARQHYCVSGYFEHRMPYAIAVDEAWYLAEYPDVRDAVESGMFASGAQHFQDAGYREGRLPHAHFQLRTR